MNINIPTVNISVSNAMNWLKAPIKLVLLIMMAFTLGAIVMQSIPLIPKWWAEPKDVYMCLISLALAFIALK